MALQDTILQEIQAGRLQPHWTTSDLLNNQSLSRSYPNTTTLRTYPPNCSTSLPGLNLGEGRNVTDQPVFYRVGRRDRALLFALPQHRTVSQQAQPATPAPSVAEKKRPMNLGRSDKQMQPDNEWSVESEHVSGFINWLVDKEKGNRFEFHYDRNDETLHANSINDSADGYNWPTNSIHQELVGHIDNFPQTASNLSETVNLLTLLREDLRDSLKRGDSLRHLKACWATLYWGGVAHPSNLYFYAGRYFRDCCCDSDGLIAYHRAAHNPRGWFDPEHTNERTLRENVKGMSAGITKIHSLLADELVIYDSRVACAMAWLVERYCDYRKWSEVPEELLFSLPQEKAGENDPPQRDPALVRPANSLLRTKYPNPGSSEKRKTTLWPRDKLRASLILSEVLIRLGNRDKQKRTDSFLKYQLGLFMIGYHLGEHGVK